MSGVERREGESRAEQLRNTLEWVELVAERRALRAGSEAFGRAVDADDAFGGGRRPHSLAAVRVVQLHRRHYAAVHYCAQRTSRNTYISYR